MRVPLHLGFIDWQCWSKLRGNQIFWVTTGDVTASLTNTRWTCTLPDPAESPLEGWCGNMALFHYGSHKAFCLSQCLPSIRKQNVCMECFLIFDIVLLCYADWCFCCCYSSLSFSFFSDFWIGLSFVSHSVFRSVQFSSKGSLFDHLQCCNVREWLASLYSFLVLYLFLWSDASPSLLSARMAHYHKSL